jgi:hypothetical protein
MGSSAWTPSSWNIGTGASPDFVVATDVHDRLTAACGGRNLPCPPGGASFAPMRARRFS